jgi:type IV pilus biogenesis protein CpaD/CtpE
MAKVRHLLKMKDRIVVQGVSVLLIFLSLAGCATQPHLQQEAQPDAQKTPEQEPAKAPMPTFTYRPGG